MGSALAPILKPIVPTFPPTCTAATLRSHFPPSLPSSSAPPGAAPDEEAIVLAVELLKINRRGKAQPRLILLSTHAVYNLSTNGKSCKRRIPLQAVERITSSLASSEFVIHVPSEYDYHFSSATASMSNAMVNALKDVRHAKPIPQLALPVPSLAPYTRTRTAGASELPLPPLPHDTSADKTEDAATSGAGASDSVAASDQRLPSFHMSTMVGELEPIDEEHPGW